MFEDDVYVKHCDKFIEAYSSNKSDIICKSDTKLPFWYPGFRIGNKSLISKAKFVYSHLYVSRYSKKACSAILNEIHNSPTTNHHELWIPYVIDLKKLSHSNFMLHHLLGLRTNPTSDPTNSITEICCEICHPYKHKI